MKKIILFIISSTLFLVAQQAGDEHLADTEYVRSGIVLAIEGDRINFDEMWLDIGLHAQKGRTQTAVTDRSGAAMSFSDLHAPCQVELTYLEIDNTFMVSKITILAQYEYDDKGFIRTGME